MSLFSPESNPSTTNQQTTNTSYADNRSVSDNRNYSTMTAIGSGNVGSTLSDIGNTETNSRNVTNTTTNTSVVATDFGAVQGALASNASTTQGALDLAKVLFSKSQDTLDANVQLAGQLASGANSAYSDATAQATGNKSLIMVAIAAVALVAVVMLKKS